jgi:hypothetical protein
VSASNCQACPPRLTELASWANGREPSSASCGVGRLCCSAQQADFVEGHPQVGVDALLGGAEVAPRIELMAGDRFRFMGHRAMRTTEPATARISKHNSRT